MFGAMRAAPLLLLLLAPACTRTRDTRDTPVQSEPSLVAPRPSARSTSPVATAPSPAAEPTRDDGDAAVLQAPSNSSRMTPLPRGPVKQLSMGNGHVCAILADDAIACGSDPNAIFPLGAIPDGRFRAVHTGMASTCAQKLDGSAICFGSPRITPVAPAGPIARMCHDNSPCVERPDGTAECFHEGTSESLGAIQPGSLACGSSYSCALTQEGSIRCVVVDKVMAFGSDAMPAANWTIPKGTFKKVFSGYQHGCALDASGVATCWGRDTDGETSPPKGAFTTLALGEKTSCGLRPDGSIECWGGQHARAPRGPFTALGITTHMDRGNTVCGVRADRTVSCWLYGD